MEKFKVFLGDKEIKSKKVFNITDKPYKILNVFVSGKKIGLSRIVTSDHPDKGYRNYKIPRRYIKVLTEV